MRDAPWLRAIGAAVALLVGADAAAQDAVVRGTVRAPDGRPVPLAEILVGDSSRARTDSVGAFVVGALPAGEIELLVRRVGFAPLAVPLRLAAGQRRTLSIELAPAPYALDPVVTAASRPGLFGRVVDESGAPIAGAEVIVAGAGRRDTTAADGGFAVGALAPADYVVAVRAPGHRPARFMVSLRGARGQEARVGLGRLAPGGSRSARAAASGFHWVDAAAVRDLDRRLTVNTTLLVPREVLARGGKRQIADVLRELPSTGLSPLPRADRGPTSIDPRGTESATSSGARDAALDAAGRFGEAPDPGDRDRACYFVDGERATQYGLTMSADWIETVEVTRNDATGTLRQKLHPGETCRSFVVLWTRR